MCIYYGVHSHICSGNSNSDSDSKKLSLLPCYQVLSAHAHVCAYVLMLFAQTNLNRAYIFKYVSTHVCTFGDGQLSDVFTHVYACMLHVHVMSF